MARTRKQTRTARKTPRIAARPAPAPVGRDAEQRFARWLVRAAALLDISVQSLLDERCDEPRDCFDLGDTAADYAEFVLVERTYEVE